MLELHSTTTVFAMSAKNKPVATVKPGETVLFHTLDCFSNTLVTEQDLFSAVPWERINPATGPLYIDGARTGDTLKVEILDIEVNDSAVTAVVPGFGVLGDGLQGEVTRIVAVRDGMVHFSEKVAVPARPMIGVIGTAPAGNADVPTGTPGTHGGNMDCKEIVRGTTLYLPVNVDGALLALGDLHAIMGDGEVSVCGIEVAGRVTVRVDVVKNSRLPLPFLVNDTHAVTIFSAENLDDAVTGATAAMHDFVCGRLGIERVEALMLLSAAADLRICQVVDPLKTCRMELPLAIAARYGYVPD